ncbi:hypothetical protein ScPMuIL_015046 [Solemya velum]
MYFAFFYANICYSDHALLRYVEVRPDDSSLFQGTVPFGSPSKKSCKSFTCVYTHLAGKAGRQSLMRSFASKLSDCARNPLCSPGKRASKKFQNQPMNDERGTGDNLTGSSYDW